jgi:hypothetical protein
MSEPVIKGASGFRQCPKCKGGTHWTKCGFCSLDTEPLYTRDDLVAVARWTLDYFSAVSKEDVQDEANDVVERLTGVKR